LFLQRLQFSLSAVVAGVDPAGGAKHTAERSGKSFEGSRRKGCVVGHGSVQHSVGSGGEGWYEGIGVSSEISSVMALLAFG